MEPVTISPKRLRFHRLTHNEKFSKNILQLPFQNPTPHHLKKRRTNPPEQTPHKLMNQRITMLGMQMNSPSHCPTPQNLTLINQNSHQPHFHHRLSKPYRQPPQRKIILRAHLLRNQWNRIHGLCFEHCQQLIVIRKLILQCRTKGLPYSSHILSWKPIHTLRNIPFNLPKQPTQFTKLPDQNPGCSRNLN
ncbi:hypothetical protein ACB098_09G116900 [Castanea mollissima]